MKKIAFLKIGSFSGINDFVLRMLKEQFPDHEIDVIDVWEDLMGYRTLAGIFFAVKEFGLRVCWNNYGMAVLRTNHSFQKAKKAVIKRLRTADYIFTFQMNSFFDLSVPGIPHFVYIDGTHLSIAGQFRRARRHSLGCIFYEIGRAVFYKNNPGWFEHIHSEIAISIQEKFVSDSVKIAQEQAVYHNARMVFTMSTDVRLSVIEQYGCPAEKVVCVYQGSHLTPSFENNLKRYQRKNILFVGREWGRKGGPDLIAAFKEMKNSHPDATLTIIGCRPEIEEKGCFVIGEIPLIQVGRYYEEASVLCVPSWVEAFGNVFVEALHYKLPIVSTRTGAIPDFVVEGENGYLVTPGNAEQLAAALIDLLGDPQKCRISGEKGYALAQEKYTWEKVGKKIRENIWQHINTSGGQFPLSPDNRKIPEDLI